MKDGAEEAITRVMDGLRGVEVPAGMEGRVLRAMAERERRSGREWVSWAVACAVLLVGVGAVLVPSLAHRQRAAAVRAGVPAVIVERTGGEGSGRVAVSPVVLKPLRRAGRMSALRPAEESLAMREMRAPSLVAPPEPLTEQEVLLLRTVHRGDPEEIAMLRPEVRAKRDAEGSAEFVAFFNPAKTGDKE